MEQLTDNQEIERLKLRLRQAVSKSNRRKSALKSLQKTFELYVYQYRELSKRCHVLDMSNRSYEKSVKDLISAKKTECNRFHLF